MPYVWDTKDNPQAPPHSLAKISEKYISLIGKAYPLSWQNSATIIMENIFRGNNVVLKWDFKIRVSSRRGLDKLPDFPFYDWYNLFCSFSESETHLRVKTEAFKYKHFRVWTGIKYTKNLIFLSLV